MPIQQTFMTKYLVLVLTAHAPNIAQLLSKQFRLGAEHSGLPMIWANYQKQDREK